MYYYYIPTVLWLQMGCNTSSDIKDFKHFKNSKNFVAYN